MSLHFQHLQHDPRGDVLNLQLDPKVSASLIELVVKSTQLIEGWNPPMQMVALEKGLAAGSDVSFIYAKVSHSLPNYKGRRGPVPLTKQ